MPSKRASAAASAPTLGFRDFREILASELVSITGGLLAGTMLAFATNQLALVPGLFILLPGFLEMRGNISGTLDARLVSGLWAGVVKPRVRRNRILRGNILADIFLAAAVSAVLGVVAWAASYLIFGINSTSLIAISLIAGIFSNVIEIPATVLVTFWLFRHGHDPNDIMGPYVTMMGDIVSIASVVLALIIL